MKLPLSKKELLRDNQKMRTEIENLLARNTELVILMEQQQKLINETNKKIEKHNEDISNINS